VKCLAAAAQKREVLLWRFLNMHELLLHHYVNIVSVNALKRQHFALAGVTARADRVKYFRQCYMGAAVKNFTKTVYWTFRGAKMGR